MLYIIRAIESLPQTKGYLKSGHHSTNVRLIKETNMVGPFKVKERIIKNY